MTRRNRWPVLLVLSVLCGPCAAQFINERVPEGHDYGLPPTSELRLDRLTAPTPLLIPGARTVRTEELREMLARPPEDRPLIFDVLGGSGHESIPGAIWLADAGRGRSFDDEVQALLERTLAILFRDGKAGPMVFFCAGVNCWLSYNAALRAVRLGYTEVGWYRGGIEAWVGTGGALAPMRVTWKRPEPK